MPDDTVRLVIAGKEFSGWTDVSIDMAIDAVADSFTLSAPFDPQDMELVSRIRPYEYQDVKVYIGADLYLSGRLEAPAFSFSPTSRMVTLSGRSLPGILVDCSAEGDDTAQMTDLTFAQIAKKVAGKLGLSIRDDDTLSATRRIPEARAEWGQTAFDYLHKLAAPHNLLINCAFDGKLVITDGDALVNYPVRANLKEGDPLILGLATSFDATKRGSLYRIGSTFAEVPDIVGEVSDPSIKPYRPKYKNCEEADQADPSATAARMMAEAIAGSLSISATLDGWRRPGDGQRWSERQIVTLQAPSVYLFKAARYVVAGLSLKLDPDNGRTSELRLVPPEVYSGALTKARKKKVDLW